MRVLLLFGAALSLFLLPQAVSRAQAPEQPAARSAPTFTAAQAARGEAVYRTACAQCHGGNLDDGPLGPPLKGVPFISKYGLQSVERLYTLTATTMPTTAPGTLTPSVYADLVAYILQQNLILAGDQELPADPARLAAMTIPEGGFAFLAYSPYTPPPPPVARPNPFDRFTPVTDALLASPPDSEWLHWRRTWDQHGFSPLAQIDRSNVGRLRVAWTWSLAPGSNESAPLVHDGVLFVHGMGDRVQALDARTGDLLWEYRRQLPEGLTPSVKRGLAIYGERIFFGTSDAHVIALEARTGKVAWDVQIGDTSQREGITSSPLVARGKVMIGTTGTGIGAKPGGPKIVALDAATGKVTWTVNTIPRPGEPGGDSWNGVPIMERSGASVWAAGSYSPETGLAFFGTGNTYDTGPLWPPVNRPGVTNELLYTNTTLAIDPDTGRIVWHFQHHPTELWDLDWAFERQIVELPVRGQTRRLIVTTGKIGIVDAVDAETGDFAFSIDLGLQNLVTEIDPESGRKIVDPSLIPDGRSLQLVCPHAAGAKNYQPAAYNASTKTIFLALTEACMDIFPRPGAAGRSALSSGINWGVRPRPDGDGRYGRLQAIDLETRQTVWSVRDRAPLTSGVLATAGGLVFSGAFDRRLRAHDDRTGDVLWSMRLNDVISSMPISYSVDGTQYIAVTTGRGAFHSNSYSVLVPELVSPVDRTAVLWVFEVEGD